MANWRVDPRWTLDEIKAHCPQVILPDKPFLSQEQDKQRYLWMIELYRFVQSTPIPVGLSIAALVISAIVGPASNVGPLDSWLYTRLLEQLNRAGLADASAEARELALSWILVALGWSSWLAWRVLVELARSDVVVPGWRSEEDWRNRDRARRRYPLALSAVALTAAGALSLCFVGFVRGPDMFFPTLDDFAIVAATKGAFLIGFAFYATGFFLFLLSPYLRYLRAQARSNMGASHDRANH